MKFLFRALDRVWSAACISVFRAFDMAEGSGHVVSRNLANVQVERSNQANLLVENDAFDRHAHARVSNLYVNQYYCCNAARFACLSRTHKWREKKKKRKKEKMEKYLSSCYLLLPLLRRNHKSLFTISARLSSFSYTSQRKYWISMNIERYKFWRCSRPSYVYKILENISHKKT